MGWDKSRFARIPLDLPLKAKARLDRFCRILGVSKAEYLRAAMREKMRIDQRAKRLSNQKRRA